MFRGWALIATVAAVAALIIVPGSIATSAPSTPTVLDGPHDLAADPASFPPANYSNPTIPAPPAVPHTTPKVLPITSYGTVAIPAGMWETVVMNYTGYVAGTAYDYFQTVTIDGAMVYVGVNPEAGSWTQLVNLSAYLSFFDDRSSITISGPGLGLIGNFEGVQINNITLLFYPIPAHQAGPSYATMVEPLFAFSGTPASAPISIPSNTSAVDLQMIAIGSEFWYSLNPDFTAVTASVGGYNVSTYLQYPWINSGGIDLFSWRPISPVNMLDHQWETFNLTGALGLLEGQTHLNVSAASDAMGGDVIANLLVYTSPSVAGAHQREYYFDQAPVKTVAQTNPNISNPNGNNYTVFDQFDSIAYGYSSQVSTSTGSYSVSLSTRESFVNLQSLNDVWQNISESEIVSTAQTTVYSEQNDRGIVVSTELLSYPLRMDIGEVLVYEYSEGADSYYNYTSYFDNVDQGYIALDTMASDLNGQRSYGYSYVNDQIFDTNGQFLSLLEFGPGFAIILNITSSYHVTNRIDTEISYLRTPDSATYSFYQYRIAGVENNSTAYYVQQTITFSHLVSYGYTVHFGRGWSG
jgi:hypothetical protein